MNSERIQELAEQRAGSILMDLVMPDAGMPERIKWNIGCTTGHLEQFAELIVRECAGVLREESERLYKLSAEEKDELFASNFEICAEKTVDNEVMILEHFGVK